MNDNRGDISHIKAEMDWKDLLRKPEKLFGYSYFYFMIFIIAVGYLYISNLTPIGKNNVAAAVTSDSSAFVEDIPLQSGRILPPVDVMKVGVSNPELIAKGKELYSVHCASCHGESGKGDGPSSGLMNPKPRNFQDLSGWKKGSKVTQIYVTLEEGLIQTVMPSFNYLPPEDRFEIIHYVRSFSAGQPTDSAEDLRMLDATYNLSAGMNIPGQIPVRKAIRILVRENSVFNDRRANILRRIETSEDWRSHLFKYVAIDAEKIVTLFVNDADQMKRYRVFTRNIMADPINAGFYPRVLRLSDTELYELHKFIILQME